MANVRLVSHDLRYAERIFNLASAPQVKDALGLVDDSVKDTENFIEWIIKEEQEGKQVSRLILNEDEEVIGITTLMFIKPEEKHCHIGTWIGHEYWGMGYNEASKFEILKIAFFELGLNTVFAGARKVNVRSQKAQEKIPYIRLNVGSQFQNEIKFLENKENQPCVLHAFFREEFIDYHNKLSKSALN